MTYSRPTIEMAPGHEWEVYDWPAGSLALAPDSALPDTSPILRAMLNKDLQPSEALDLELGGGGESWVYELVSTEGELAIKVPDTFSLKDPKPRVGAVEGFHESTLRLARYGGVCVERALQGTMFLDKKLTTPHYEGVFGGRNFQALIMTKIPGVTIGGLVDVGMLNEKAMLNLTRKVNQLVYTALINSGLSEDVSRYTDVCVQNLLVGYEDGQVDWAEIAVIDAIHALDDDHRVEIMWQSQLQEV